jgi:hypothetical protein
MITHVINFRVTGEKETSRSFEERNKRQYTVTVRSDNSLSVVSYSGRPNDMESNKYDYGESSASSV